MQNNNEIYYDTLADLADNNNLGILSCNHHKAMCIQNKEFVLITYTHTSKGYKLEEEREHFKTWQEFRKDYLNKIKG